MSKKSLRLAQVKGGLAATPATELKFEDRRDDGEFVVEFDEVVAHIEKLMDADGELILKHNDQTHRVFWHRERDAVYLATGGHHYRFDRVQSADVEASGNDASHADITAPMTGKIVKVSAQAGDEVAEGATVVIVEAMKMEHELKAPFAAVVESLDADEGAQVDLGQVLARLARVEKD